jgi:hypothetical protein
MMFVVLMAGIGLLLAGLLTVGLGIQMDLSFGNTLILTGAIAACTGMIMLSLWAVARELKKIALRLGAGISGDPRPATVAATAPSRNQAVEIGALPPGRDQRRVEDLDNLELEAPPSAPWQGDAGGRDRGRSDGAIMPERIEAVTAAKPRRNLMFSSSSKKERERAQVRKPDLPGPDLGPPPPPLELNEVPPASFDDPWPTPERAHDVPPPRRGGRAPSTFAEATAGVTGPDRYAPAAARNADRQAVTILKSGVVDGMAYSLYSDGSIEAQMPEGMMRFASIDELRAHLDQRE